MLGGSADVNQVARSSRGGRPVGLPRMGGGTPKAHGTTSLAVKQNVLEQGGSPMGPIKKILTVCAVDRMGLRSKYAALYCVQLFKGTNGEKGGWLWRSL